MFDITGLTELYGPGTGIECSHHDCIHYWADYYIVEVVDPEILQPVPAGEVVSIISVIEGFGSEYQIHLSRDADSGRDSLKLIVERRQQSDCGNDASLTGKSHPSS